MNKILFGLQKNCTENPFKHENNWINVAFLLQSFPEQKVKNIYIFKSVRDRSKQINVLKIGSEMELPGGTNNC